MTSDPGAKINSQKGYRSRLLQGINLYPVIYSSIKAARLKIKISNPGLIFSYHRKW